MPCGAQDPYLGHLRFTARRVVRICRLFEFICGLGKGIEADRAGCPLSQ